MRTHVFRLGLPTVLFFLGACSGDQRDESLATVLDALTTTESILSFEGTTSNSGSNLQWRGTTGSATSVTPPSHLSKAMSVGFGWNPSAISAPLSALGALSGPPKIDVRFPSGYANQSAYWGQVALYVSCSSANIFNHYVGPVALAGGRRVYKTYSFPSLPPNVATALSSKNGCTVAVQLNLSNSGSKPVFVDHLTFGESFGGSSGSGGLGGATGGGTAGAPAGAGGSGGGG